MIQKALQQFLSPNLGLFLLFTAASGMLGAGQFTLRPTISDGGLSRSDTYTVHMVIGQPVVGTIQGGNYSLCTGFGCTMAPTSTPTITPTTTADPQVTDTATPTGTATAAPGATPTAHATPSPTHTPGEPSGNVTAKIFLPHVTR